jgi:predicted metal-dependent HD superfamily phosphohydrolase
VISSAATCSFDGRAVGLAARWADAVIALGGDPALASESGADLEHRYGERPRAYHHASHALFVIETCIELARPAGVSARDVAVLSAAAATHDVVYEGRAGEDERASAAWANASLLACKVDPESARRVAVLVLATEHHQPTAGEDPDPLLDLLCDADLAVLGGDVAGYERYRAAVRAEYAQISDEQWRSGRSAILRELLGRPQLFRTEAGQRRWESTARANIAAELAALGG